MENNHIKIENLTKYYGHRKVIDHLNLTVKSGEFFTIYGPNGAGKTTLLMLLSTLIKPSEGIIKAGNTDYSQHKSRIRQITGMVSHSDYLYENLTAYENLDFFASLYGIKGKVDRIIYLLEKMELYTRKDDLIRNYSRGMKKRISIARSLVHDPLIILFDEPFSGLDQKAIRTFCEILSWLKENNRTVILSTHNIKYVWNLSDRIGIMNAGRIDNIVEYSPDLESEAEKVYDAVCNGYSLNTVELK